MPIFFHDIEQAIRGFITAVKIRFNYKDIAIEKRFSPLVISK